MDMKKINWFPGHMVKTRREITANLKLVDAVIEIRDARIVASSQNPEIDKIVGDKPRIILLNKADMAEDQVTRRWKKSLENENTLVLEVNALTGKGLNAIKPTLNELLKDKIARNKERGIVNYTIRAMVVGIPNVGKSSFINRMAKNAIAKVGNRPGVTKNKQWIKTKEGIELLDTPGILWPKFEEETSLNLAFTGAIKDEIMDTETLALRLIERLSHHYKERLIERYALEEFSEDPLKNMDNIARKRGCIIKGGEIDYMRVAVMILDEFRSAKLGKISLEWPEVSDD